MSTFLSFADEVEDSLCSIFPCADKWAMFVAGVVPRWDRVVVFFLGPGGAAQLPPARRSDSMTIEGRSEETALMTCCVRCCGVALISAERKDLGGPLERSVSWRAVVNSSTQQRIDHHGGTAPAAPHSARHLLPDGAHRPGPTPADALPAGPATGTG